MDISWNIDSVGHWQPQWSRIKIGSTLDFRNSEISWWNYQMTFWISRWCIDNLGPLPAPPLEKYFKPWLGFCQLEGVAKVWVELFWKFKKNRNDSDFFISPRRWPLFSVGGFSTCLPNKESELSVQAGWKSTKTEKSPSSWRNKKITVDTILLKLSKQLYPYLGYAFQLTKPQPMLEIFSERPRELSLRFLLHFLLKWANVSNTRIRDRK